MEVNVAMGDKSPEETERQEAEQVVEGEARRQAVEARGQTARLRPPDLALDAQEIVGVNAETREVRDRRLPSMSDVFRVTDNGPEHDAHLPRLRQQ
jgi:hypothetical protein